MGYGARELIYAAPFANALVQDSDFRSWVLGKTKFADYANTARLLDREMLAKRSKKTATWWRSHFSEKCRCFGCSGQETDLLAVFETPTGMRFALNVEVKHPGDKFKPDQASAYPARAKCWTLEAKTPKHVLAHAASATGVLFSEGNRKKFAPDLQHFETQITFEEIADRFPNVGFGVYVNCQAKQKHRKS